MVVQECCCAFELGIERYWYWDIGYWAIFAILGRIDIGPIFFVGRTPDTILSALVCRPDDKHLVRIISNISRQPATQGRSRRQRQGRVGDGGGVGVAGRLHCTKNKAFDGRPHGDPSHSPASRPRLRPLPPLFDKQLTSVHTLK